MSKKLEVTPWFPASVMPTRNGLYIYKYSYGRKVMAHWNGEAFFLEDSSFLYTKNSRITVRGKDQWRGLTKASA